MYSRRSRLLECCGVIVVWLLGVCGGGSIGSMIDGKLAARSCVKSSGVDGMSGGAVVVGIGCCGCRLYTVSIGAVSVVHWSDLLIASICCGGLCLDLCMENEVGFDVVSEMWSVSVLSVLIP